MNNKFIITIAIVIFVVSFFVGNWLNGRNEQVMQLEKISMQYSACNPVMNTCQAMLQNVPISIVIPQQPSALKPFEIEVRSNLSDIDDVRIDFRMQSMNMGVNFYHLDKINAGTWKGKATLPVCTSRRSDWIVELQINHQGKLWIAEYAFTQSVDN